MRDEARLGQSPALQGCGEVKASAAKTYSTGSAILNIFSMSSDGRWCFLKARATVSPRPGMNCVACGPRVLLGGTGPPGAEKEIHGDENSFTGLREAPSRPPVEFCVLQLAARGPTRHPSYKVSWILSALWLDGGETGLLVDLIHVRPEFTRYVDEHVRR